MDTWALATVAFLLLVFAALSHRLKRSYVTLAIFFTSTGLLAGPALGLLDLELGSEPIKLLAQATLTLVLFSDASRISIPALRREFSVPARLLGLGLPLTIAAGTVAGVTVLPGVSLAEALVLAVMLACTDAALGQAVVTDRRIPSRIRQGLNVESGLNDGVCVPLLLIFLAVAKADEEEELAPVRVVLEQIGYGAIAGLVAGALGAWVLATFARRGWITDTWQQIIGVVTPMLAYTAAVALGGSGFIAAFVAGLVFAAVSAARAEPATALADESGELLNAMTFLFFGAVLLGPALDELDWRIGLYAVLSLTVVRMLPVAIATWGLGMRGVTVGFLGWFGPRGLASIVFGLIVLEESGLPERSELLTIVTLTVALSVFAHGLTAWPWANRYADWYDATQVHQPSMPESAPVSERRTRVGLVRRVDRT